VNCEELLAKHTIIMRVLYYYNVSQHAPAPGVVFDRLPSTRKEDEAHFLDDLAVF
jgi:hypothetical protein